MDVSRFDRADDSRAPASLNAEAPGMFRGSRLASEHVTDLSQDRQKARVKTMTRALCESKKA
jgi:hypothetical protein